MDELEQLAGFTVRSGQPRARGQAGQSRGQLQTPHRFVGVRDSRSGHKTATSAADYARSAKFHKPSAYVQNFKPQHFLLVIRHSLWGHCLPQSLAHLARRTLCTLSANTCSKKTIGKPKPGMTRQTAFAVGSMHHCSLASSGKLLQPS